MKLPLAFTFISLICILSCRSADRLTVEDEKALKTLYEAFRDSDGSPSSYPKFFEEQSLTKYMQLHKRFINGFIKLRSKDRLREIFEVGEDLDEALGSKNASTYFAAFRPVGGARVDVARGLAGRLAGREVVGVGGTQSKAFIIVQVKYGRDGDEERFYAVWPAVKTGKEWRLLVTSDWFQKMRRQIESIRIMSGEPLEEDSAEQAGARQPATAPDSKSEGKEKPKPESEERSQ